MSGLELPELNVGTLDGETLERLLQDLAACAEVLEVQVKGSAEAHAQGGGLGLIEAGRLLIEGRARGVQVRYLFEEALWCDTLIAGPAGVRLVRMRMEEAS